MTDTPEVYPLQWPVGWPETQRPTRARFGAGGSGTTLYVARHRLLEELRKLKAINVVISTNIPLRRDGLPMQNVREPEHHGVAVYFRHSDKPHVLGCDKWDRVADNMVALSKHVAAIRGMARWGVGSIEQALGGYKALPAMPSEKPWHEVLEMSPAASWQEVEKRRVALLKIHHPDLGGDPKIAAEIGRAYDEARREFGR